MSVADNIEFALRARKVGAAERRRRRKELLKLVSLQGLGDRLPTELSGGQQQRVAVARALAHEPRVLLLDEPFGALDAKIRDDLRRAIRDIQRAVGITAILVTHDQEEAFTMADRIGVMDRGRLQETDEPRVLYTRPRTRFVATFLGAANLLLGHHEQDGVRIGESTFELNRWSGIARPGAEVTVVIRPEDIALARSGVHLAGAPIGRGIVQELEFVGMLERVRLTVTANPSLTSALRPAAAEFPLEASRSARDAESIPLTVGQSVSVGAKRVHVLPTPISSLRLLAASEAEAAELASTALIRELAERMHIAPVPHALQERLPQQALGGLAIVKHESPTGLDTAIGVLEQGAHQVLSVGDGQRRIEQLLIYIQPTRPARDAALAAAGTLLRHLAVDAMLLVPGAERSLRGTSYRDLLDIRHAALRAHGVDVRTESFHGGAVEAISGRLDPAVHTLLLIGVTSMSSGLIDELRTALAVKAPAATLIVRGSAVAEAETHVIAYPRRRAAISAG